LRLNSHRGGGVNCERLQGQYPPARYEWKYVNELVPTWDNCEAWRLLATYNWRYGSPAECVAAVRRREQLASLTLPEAPDPVSLPYGRLIAEDADGVYWFWSYYGHNSVVIRYDGETAQIMPWTGEGVRAIVPAGVKDGVWLGTNEGLFYSDGRTVQQYQLLGGRLVPCGPTVRSLAVTGDGHVWASTSEGLVRFDAEGEEWQPIAGGEEETAIESDVSIAPDDQHGLWALHRGSLFHLDGQTRRSWPFPIEIRRCEAHAVAAFRGEVWVAAGKCGLWRFDGQAWDGPALDIKALTLIQGRDGKLYVQESGGPPYVYDGRTWTQLPERGWADLYAPVPPPTPAPAGMSLEDQKAPVPMPMAVDVEGDIWGASETHIRRYSAAGEWADVLPLPGNFFVVQSLFVDSRGDLWVGGLRGLLHYDGEHWEDVSIRDDTRLFPITALAEDQQGRIWVSGDNGLSVYDPAAGE
jgi:ligand-binding sensor domain-containing protein